MEGLWFKQSSLIACNYQPSRCAAAANSSHYNLELNHGLSCQTANQIMVLQDITWQSLLGFPWMLWCIYGILN